MNSNGEVVLTSSGIGVENGDVAVKDLTAQTATLSAAHNLTLVESLLSTTSDLNLLAQDTVRVRDSVANPFIAVAGGNLYIQGNQSIDLLALNHLSQAPFVSGENLSLVSNGNISGDAHFTSDGNISILNLDGSGGNLLSLYDPIYLVAGDYIHPDGGSYTGAALKVQAGGNIIFNGDITIDKPETQINENSETGDYNFAWNIPDGRILSLNVPASGLPVNQAEDLVSSLDKFFEQQYEEYFGENVTDEVVSVESIRATLKTIESKTGKSSVVVYVRPLPGEDQLQLVLVLPEGTPISKTIPNGAALQETLKEFSRAVATIASSRRDYLEPAKKLHEALITPIEPYLEALGIDTLIFCMDAGLRQIPLAALYDGEQFLV